MPPYSKLKKVVQVFGDYTYLLSDGQRWNARKIRKYFPPEMFADLNWNIQPDEEMEEPQLVGEAVQPVAVPIPVPAPQPPQPENVEPEPQALARWVTQTDLQPREKSKRKTKRPDRFQAQP